jgi:hypothetical protein
VFVLLGFFLFVKKIYISKKFSEFDIFLTFNILSILYFLGISGFWGNPKYFAPCMISIIFWFSMGVEKIFISFQKNNNLKG